MEVADLVPLVERLEDNIDDLEEVLEPLLERSLAETSRKLPLLDKAKLHVLLTYTLESLLFSYLRLRGVNAREHAVFKELTRVKQYFEKIKALETEPEKRTLTLDKQAAGRFIKHGLAGNDKYDLERAEKEAKEKARAQMRAALLAKKQIANTQEYREENHPSTSNPDSDADSSSDSTSTSIVDIEKKTAALNQQKKQAAAAEPSIPQKTAKAKSKERREQAKAEKAQKKLKQQGQGEQKEAKNEAKEARRKKHEKKKARKMKKNQAAKERRAGNATDNY